MRQITACLHCSYMCVCVYYIVYYLILYYIYGIFRLVMHAYSLNKSQVASGRKKETCSNICVCSNVCVCSNLCVCGCGDWCAEAGWDLGGGRLLHNCLACGMVWFSSVDMLYLCCVAGWEEDAYDIRRVHDTFSQR